MSKKWYNYFVSVDPGEEGASAPEERSEPPSQTSPQSAAQAVADIAASVRIEPKFAQTVSTTNSFDEIYSAAEIRPPAHGFTVFKVAEMLQNQHIRDLPKEIKRSSVLVALDSSGVKVQEIVEDAVRRDKALDTFERVQRKAVEELEARKMEENKQAQAEVDRIIAEFRTRIQANNDAIAREKQRFESWLEKKRQEEQKIAETVGYFVSENPVTIGLPAAAPPEPKPGSAR